MNETNPHPPAGKKTRRVLLIAALALVGALLLAGAVGMIYLHRWRSGQWEPSPVLKQAIKEVADTSELKAEAKALKGDMKELFEAIKKQDLGTASSARADMLRNMADMRKALSSPLLTAASISPDMRAELQSAEELLALLEEADSSLIVPTLKLLEELPLSALKDEEGGLRVEALRRYLDFAETVIPEVRALADRAESVDLRLLDTDGKFRSYQEKLGQVRELCGQAEPFLPAIRAILGDGGDRLYLFAAQNSSEIRAAGGFPGSMGRVRIQDGRLTVSDFQSVYNLLAKTTPGTANITDEENLLFSSRMYLSWDSSFSPDFERAAAIWALAYEVRFDEKVDGVISCTPAVIPRLLAVLGEVTLSDGTVLNGDNAGRVLGHDLYFQYLGVAREAGAAAEVDDLFAEAARGTLDLLFSQVNAKTLLELLPLLRDSAADRTLMFWMADEAEQVLIRAAGWDAGLNRDETHPAAGVFFNSTVASKTAWFLALDTELSEPEQNEDGSQTYTLTLRLQNTITPEERAAAGGYILGNSNGITGSVYVFAPAGGRIDEAVTDRGYVLPLTSYEGLQTAYFLKLTLIQDPVVITCRITTSPAAEAPMTLMTTPTMQEYW